VHSKIKFTLHASDDGKEVFTAPLSYEALANIISNYPDHDDSNDFFLLAAKHPACIVRENIAYKDHLSAEVVEILAKDRSVPVLRHLVRSSAFREQATYEQLEKFINLDIEIAQSIANNVELFQEADIVKLANLLAAHEDPSVAASLADNYNAPKKILKKLLTHPDPYVANAAKARLEN
jgi:hypothetical protein